MELDPNDYRRALERASEHALDWISSLPERPVLPELDVGGLLASIDIPFPENGSDAAAVVDELAALAAPGLMAMPSGRFFGWVIGGTLPAAMGADWLVSAWDQNAAMRYPTPATAALEQVAGSWLLDVLGLPPESDVGFTTGATMANWTGLAAA